MAPAIPILVAAALVALFASGSSAAPAAPVEPDEGPPPGPGPSPGPPPGPRGGTTPIEPGDIGPDDGGASIYDRAARDVCEGKARFAIDSGDPDVMWQVADEIQGDCPDLAQVLREAADDAASWF